MYTSVSVCSCMHLFALADVFVTESRDNILCSWMFQCKKTCLHEILTTEGPTCHIKQHMNHAIWLHSPAWRSQWMCTRTTYVCVTVTAQGL